MVWGIIISVSIEIGKIKPVRHKRSDFHLQKGNKLMYIICDKGKKIINTDNAISIGYEKFELGVNLITRCLHIPVVWIMMARTSVF